MLDILEFVVDIFGEASPDGRRRRRPGLGFYVMMAFVLFFGSFALYFYLTG